MNLIRIGYRAEEIGSVGLTAQGFAYLGDAKRLADLLARIRQTYPDDTDAQFYHRLPQMMNNGYYWAHEYVWNTTLTPAQFDALLKPVSTE